MYRQVLSAYCLTVFAFYYSERMFTCQVLKRALTTDTTYPILDRQIDRTGIIFAKIDNTVNLVFTIRVRERYTLVKYPRSLCMKRWLLLFIVFLLLGISGCYLPITAMVIDADTGKPIEGAVVLVEWTKTHGIGDHWTESYKVASAYSNESGKFSLPGCYGLFVDAPTLTIYKKGYVAWSSSWIFPRYKNRTDYNWGNSIIKLEHFKDEYSHDDHTSFVSLSIHSSLAKNYELKKIVYHEIEWEQDLAFHERMKKKR